MPGALQYTLSSGSMILPALFLLKIVLTIQGLFVFPFNFRIICSSSVKNVIGIFIGIALNLYIALGNMVILTILILPIHEHSIYFYLSLWSSISFISVLQFSKYFTSLVTFIPRCFILFDVTVNVITFLISFSESLFLVSRNATDFSVLILHPATLPNSSMRQQSFGGVFGIFYSQYYVICIQ